MRRATRALAAGLAVHAGVIAMTVATPDALGAATTRPDVAGAAPAPGSHLDRHGAFFVISARADDLIDQSLIITNPYDHPLTVDISGVDASTSNSTGAEYGTPGSQPTHVGSWITTTTPEIQLAPREQREVSFQVAVPHLASSGQHLGGISVAVPLRAPTTPTTTPGSRAAFAMTLQSQRVIAVEVDIAGARAPTLVVHGVGVNSDGHSVTLQVAIANTGNAFARGTGTITVADTATHHEFTIDTFVPGTAISYTVPWTKNAVKGTHDISVRLDYNGRIATWSGELHIDEQRRQALARSLRAGQAPTRGDASSAAVAGWIAAAALATASAVALRVRRRRAAAFA